MLCAEVCAGQAQIFDSAETLSVHPSKNLRACPEFIEGMNGGVVEMMEDCPFMLSLVEAYLRFQQNRYLTFGSKFCRLDPATGERIEPVSDLPELPDSYGE